MRKYSESIEDQLNTLDTIRVLDFFKSGFTLTQDDRLCKFDLALSPWVSVVCEWFEDSGTDWIFLIQGSQTCKTTTLMGFLLYVSQHVRGAVPCLWVSSIDEEAKIFVSDRLKPFLQESKEDALKNWKRKSFRVNNALVKVGYASGEESLRTKPCKYIFGDECGLWVIPISYTKKRTRTFYGSRKGFFSTTPPKYSEHDSWKEAISGNFYRWFVACPDCWHSQNLFFKNLKWEGKENGEWNFETVRKTARYHCEKCGSAWSEEQKLSIINSGKAVCVDYKTFQPIEEKKSDSKTLNISALYSVFTPWGQLAVDFIKAKHLGRKALAIFYTDELAEIPPDDEGESLQKNELAKFIDNARPAGLKMGYDLYTAGVDIQALGEYYYVVLGWKSGILPSAHVLKYGKGRWKEGKRIHWDNFLSDFAQYRKYLYLCALDASFGGDAPDIYNFVNSQGHPFLALKEVPTQFMKVKYEAITIDPVTKQRFAFGQQLMEVNSHMLKDSIAAAFSREPFSDGSWSLHAETEEEFLKHLTNEKRIIEDRRGQGVSVWVPRYSGAPQHWFSALVYASACAEERLPFLQKRVQIEEQTKPVLKQKNKASWVNYDNWKINKER